MEIPQTHILLIEDNPGDAYLIQFMLQRLPNDAFQLVHREKLTDGLTYLIANHVDVIVLDLGLPDSQGYETFQTVSTQVPDVPIILLTGFADDTLALEAVRHGAQDYLIKGEVDGETLQRTIHYAIERKQVEVALATRLRYEEGLAEVSRALLSPTDIHTALNQALSHLRFASQTNWVCIFENFNDPELGICTQLQYEAYTTFASPLSQNTAIHTLSYAQHLAQWQQLLTDGKSICGLLSDIAPEIALHLGQHHIQSLLVLPLFVSEVWYGFIVFGDTQPTRVWEDENVRLLRTAADIIGTGIQTRRDAETKSVLLREVNHRVKNNLSAIVGFLYAELLRADLPQQPLYRDIIQELITRVQGLATVHSMLSAVEWAALLLPDLTQQIIQSACDMAKPECCVIVHVTPTPVYVTADQAHHLALVINELATNVVKHTLREQTVAQINVTITENDNIVSFEFRDDGHGYPQKVLTLEEHNVGFDLISGIVHHNLQGTLTLKNDPGAVALITFPLQHKT